MGLPLIPAATAEVHSHSVDKATALRALGPGAVEIEPGWYQVTLPDGYTFTTHGPDPASAFIGHESDLGPGDPEREPVCADEHAQHILYGRPSLVTESRLAQFEEEIRAHFRRMNAVVNEAAEVSGGTTADLRVLCDENGRIRIDEFENTTLLPYVSFVFQAARNAGFTDPTMDYTIFYDGEMPGICGQAELSRDTSPGIDNGNNAGGYGVTYQNCWFSRTPLHENGHNQGAVQTGAPNEDGTNHCTEQQDIMCYPSTSTQCSVMDYDCGFDTYFDASPEPGEWLATHWNIGSRVNRYIEFGDTATTLEETEARRIAVGLLFRPRDPRRGARTTAAMWLADCEGHEGTQIDLQRKVNGRFKTIDERRLDDRCEATTRLKADFHSAVFRSLWRSPDRAQLDSASKPVRLQTR
ncbi:MAG TPA: hypothetical protein VJ927_03035 [Actinomycetota bacterium]|nr:hypothetical protein [Actinomycetota bacterium]